MSDPNGVSLRQPETITEFNELEVAKRKARINATQDRQLLINNLAELRSEGPAVILKNVVLPVVGVGVAIWGVGKLVSSLTKPDTRTYYVEPHDDDHDGPVKLASRGKDGKSRAVRLKETRRTGVKTRSAIASTKYIPVAVQLAKMGVSYLEKNGGHVPQFVYDLLSGPGVSARPKVKPGSQQI